MKKVFKRVSLLALSALMLGTAGVSFASCGGEDEVIDVFVFAGTEDQETNTVLVENWAKKYAAKLVAEGKKEEGFEIKTNCTFQSDTTQYFASLANTLAAGTAPDVFYVSPKYVKAYSKVGYVLDLTDYIDFSSTDSNYDINKVFGASLGFYAYDGQVIGSEVHYDTTQKKFINEEGRVAGLYALPKDYSSFGLGYNANFFTDAMKQAYANTGAIAADTYGGKSIIRNAATGADAAGVINVGVPTTYYPYNFYVYGSYEDALAAGDPVAAASKANNGYTVTIPGYPGETFAMTEDSSTAYDSSFGYVTYTYAEYSAVSWAVCYYYNKYLPDHATVYGNDQYEGTLYLLPWLAGNDADYINAKEGTKTSDGSKVTAYQSVESGTYTAADGTTINYGIDNEEFIETYAAFAAYGSDWNANSYYAGDGMTAGGYAQFKEGNVVFYGVGTWDAAGFNQVSPDVLKYSLMPEPVSEDYALYSRIKDAKYEQQVYMSNGQVDADGKVALNTTVPASFTTAQIEANQLLRQNQWKARMDSVGYGVNGDLANSKSDWLAEACADLVANMTVDRDSQVELTLAGSQLPNYADQCEDYLYKTGAFANVITPDDANYNEYYQIVTELVANTDRNTTVSAWMAANYPNHKYNANFADYTCKRIANSTIGFQALNMISLDYKSRNVAVRMVSGENGTKDSCMYTFDAAWIDVFSANKAGCMIAYTQKVANTYNISSTFVNSSTTCTPYAYCMNYVKDTQASLNESIKNEQLILG